MTDTTIGRGSGPCVLSRRLDAQRVNFISVPCSCLWLEGPSNSFEIFSQYNAHKTTRDMPLFISCVCPFYHHEVQSPGNREWHLSHVILTLTIIPVYKLLENTRCSARSPSSASLLAFLSSPAKVSWLLHSGSLK